MELRLLFDKIGRKFVFPAVQDIFCMLWENVETLYKSFIIFYSSTKMIMGLSKFYTFGAGDVHVLRDDIAISTAPLLAIQL